MVPVRICDVVCYAHADVPVRLVPFLLMHFLLGYGTMTGFIPVGIITHRQREERVMDCLFTTDHVV